MKLVAVFIGVAVIDIICKSYSICGMIVAIIYRYHYNMNVIYIYIYIYIYYAKPYVVCFTSIAVICQNALFMFWTFSDIDAKVDN